MIQEDTETKNIVFNYGEVVAVPTRKGYKYALPGGGFTHSRVVAFGVAQRMDKMIRNNMKKYDRTFF